MACAMRAGNPALRAYNGVARGRSRAEQGRTAPCGGAAQRAATVRANGRATSRRRRRWDDFPSPTARARQGRGEVGSWWSGGKERQAKVEQNRGKLGSPRRDVAGERGIMRSRSPGILGRGGGVRH
ncbi:hypothetical protein PVAP13_9NG312142 [Panicum virgatum]|uniref:Uncharacterized protein n=1 Tax=Panicum virgatum TaxID=38727 RepID=A0A8T0MQ27_PANVG|nr:hypothetical protein PVAP13_9NG312142 [Panicum virgatum]